MSRGPVPQCPIRVGEPCTLCVPGATGPQDCGLVWLVQDDPEMRAELARRRTELAEERRQARGGAAGAPDTAAR